MAKPKVYDVLCTKGGLVQKIRQLQADALTEVLKDRPPELGKLVDDALKLLEEHYGRWEFRGTPARFQEGLKALVTRKTDDH